MSDTYKCAYCKGIFTKIRNDKWSEEKALEECKSIFGDVPEGELAVVCDDCWNIIKPNKLINQ